MIQLLRIQNFVNSTNSFAQSTGEISRSIFIDLKEDRTVWYSEVDGSLKIQVQVKNPDEDTTYQNYLQERKERVELLRKSGMPFSKAYKETVCYLWEKYHRIYYYCYTLVSNAIHLNELIEILRAAIQDDIL